MLSWEQSSSLAQMQRERAWVEIDLAAIAHNVTQIKRLLQNRTAFMAVVKADAYGHGSIAIAQAALQARATWLGVATIPEGIELRESGIQAPILILGATYTPEQIRAIARWNLQPTLCTPKQALVFAETIANLPNASPLPVHLKLDTGMSRLGTDWQAATEFAQLVHRLPHLSIASIYSHLATAESLDRTVVNQQRQRFETAIAQIKSAGITPPKLHLANSAGTLTDANLHYDMVRVGLALYGLYPAAHLKSVLALKPVLQVKARITQLKTIQAGTGVSYGHRFIADRELAIAVVGIGYADGIPRNLSNQMTAIVQGQLVPQIGAVTMDQLMLDVSQVPHLQEGDVVTLLGHDGKESISAEDWAETLGTISWEILCSFKHRLPRVAITRALPDFALDTKCQ
ncbi:alanine racemase [Phormidium sp. CLA17]|uniref:alanine racemase n=1 Tax=Leptolyngbya sp. Cla-17 TaxID=2803751 RepID=UPI001491C2CC|nr:alanine racemase [Leptolyngbya sp. Cla-17]MBM0740736.1 alanine racemase [Leptolyngbya sp. Cla-17]